MCYKQQIKHTRKEKAKSDMFWKIFIKAILKGKDFYTRGVSIGKDIFVITIEKFKPPLEEMERWKEAFEETKASD